MCLCLQIIIGKPMHVCMFNSQGASIFLYILFCFPFKPFYFCGSHVSVYIIVYGGRRLFKNLKFLSDTPSFMLLPCAGSQTVLWHLLCFSHAAKYMLQNCHSLGSEFLHLIRETLQKKLRGEEIYIARCCDRLSK